MLARGRRSERIVDVMPHRGSPWLPAALDLLCVCAAEPQQPVAQQLLDLERRLVGERGQRRRSWPDTRGRGAEIFKLDVASTI
jgi:hypothetical protein